MSTLLLWSITLALFAIGTIGIFVPAVPGVLLVFGGVLFYGVATGFADFGWGTVAIFGGVAALAWVSDYVGGVVGAKLGGGRKLTLLGLMLGALIGLIAGGPPGFVMGSLGGAMLGALYEGKSRQEATRAALFSFLGIIGARVVQLILALGMVIAFLGIVL